MKHAPLLIANWKSYRTLAETDQWLAAHAARLAQESARAGVVTVICPEVVALWDACRTCARLKIRFAGQRCDPWSAGRSTGGVSARSLRELGAWGALVGHAETCGSLEDRVTAIHELWSELLVPILCWSGSVEEFARCIALLSQHAGADGCQRKLVVAVEPRSAIGTDHPMEWEEMEQWRGLIESVVCQHLPHVALQVIYGGSVTPDVVRIYQKNQVCNGFLVGRASLDMQMLETMIHLLSHPK